MKIFFSLTIFSLLAATSFCLYGSNSEVVILTANNFQKEVIESNNIWLVEFFGKK